MSTNSIKNQKDIQLPLVSRESSFQKDMQLLGLLSRKSSQHKDIFSNFPINNMPLPRNDSVGNHGNIFLGFGQQQQPKPAIKLSLAQTYALQCLEYEKYLYNNQIKMIIRRMAIRAYNVFRSDKNNQFFTFSIQKLLGIIAKKLLLNRFQLLFLEYAFVQTKWNYDIDCIKKHVHHFNSFVLVQDSQMPTQAHKYMQIYLLYCAYYSKKSLNQLPSDNIFHQFLIGVCPKFKQFFPEWTQKSNVANKINPKALNNIFKRLTFYSDRDHQQEQNYSLIVEQIIDISPSYNADKNTKKKKNQSKKKKKQKKIQQYDQIQMQNNQSCEDYNNNHRLPRYQHDFQMEQLPILKTKKSSFISNVDALQPRHYLTRSLSNE